jgi:hypothetical protein
MGWLFGRQMGRHNGVAGPIVIALNLGFVIYGFYLYLISSVLWSVAGWVQREVNLFVQTSIALESDR